MLVYLIKLTYFQGKTDAKPIYNFLVNWFLLMNKRGNKRFTPYIDPHLICILEAFSYNYYLHYITKPYIILTLIVMYIDYRMFLTFNLKFSCSQFILVYFKYVSLC
jgi:hypothetical protein